ncbi:MAG TPA: hypothetical protein VJB98_00950 [Candidatus Paceibacterota bacterium]
MVTIEEFKEVVALLDASGAQYWIYGGLALEGHRGALTREHKDIDIYAHADDAEKLLAVLAQAGFVANKKKIMYFLSRGGEKKIGIARVSTEGDSYIIHGNRTTDKYPAAIFANPSSASISGFSFPIVPNEMLVFESRFSEHPEDQEFCKTLACKLDLFAQIKSTPTPE